MAALKSVAPETGTLFSIFHNSLVLYATLALLFVGLGLAVFSFGSIFASGESSLESLINRYSGEGDGELNEKSQPLCRLRWCAGQLRCLRRLLKTAGS